MICKNLHFKTREFSRTTPNFHSYRIRPGLNGNSFRRTLVLGFFRTNVCKKEETFPFSEDPLRT
ncbi:hypothetical protein CH352_12095 [Leptospira hartskeerlii]|uniref:Uncharacterized protein n=1 Tax=Leptospira hartskeerlii TaxID=2023177 RepID=A0A2M9XBB6_9LEPT|nr:hypothetical protein CH357_14785 [Leptospira hartskeerlii]PJZ33065.1 hypothetical protein CH352_12095 [Leptospira hartskeerlii]